MPVLTSISPRKFVGGGSGVHAHRQPAAGSSPSSVVRWNGANTTTFVNGTQLRASISASDRAALGTAAGDGVQPRHRAAVSASPLAFTVSPQPTLTVSAATVGAPGIQRHRDAAQRKRRIDGLAGAGGDSRGRCRIYIQWVYVGTGVTTRTWTVTMPATAGTYQFRLFLNNGYTSAPRRAHRSR